MLPIPTHPPYVSWRHRGSHRKLQWQLLNVGAAHFGAPLTRFVAPEGAQPKAPVAAVACGSTAHFSAPLTRFVAAR
eukprot:9487086-Pyramimonas_sp.AAC.1